MPRRDGVGVRQNLSRVIQIVVNACAVVLLKYQYNIQILGLKIIYFLFWATGHRCDT